ncbi:MAG: DNA recombination protein RmuC [Ruminococcaceae bacterium]|nr:DNA recombination protein RmuC [Oscillospiraceae bacterium]
MDTVLLVLGIITVLLLLIIVIKLFSERKDASPVTDEKIDNLTKITMDGFAGQRNDRTASDEAVRNVIASSLDSMGNKMDRLSEISSEGQINVIRALSDMREKLDTTGRYQTDAVTRAVEKLQLSNEKKLEEMRVTVDEKLTSTLTTRLDSSFKSVSEQLSNVYKSLGEMKELSTGVTALNRIFTNVKTRGNWAETQLEGILDQIIPGMYVKNYRSDDKRDVVEFAVIIPEADSDKKTYLPIDSKFPMEDYLRLCDAADSGDAEGVKNARKALETRVLAEGKAVSKYIDPPFTTPFAVMYLATDSLYAEIISSKENIADRLHDEYGVLLAGPSTITALLSSLAMGFKTVALNQKANEVMDLLSAAKVQYDKFGIALDKAKKKLDEASSSIDDAQKRNSIIVKKLKGVEAIDVSDADRLLDT